MHPDTRKLNIAERDLAVAEATIRQQREEIARLKEELRARDLADAHV